MVFFLFTKLLFDKSSYFVFHCLYNWHEIVHFLSVARKKTEPKERARKRPVSEAVCPIFQNTQ